MNEGALFVAWGAPLPGREILALDIFNEVKLFNEGLKKRGEISSFEPFVLSPYGGPIHGFFLLRGEQAKLARLTANEEFVNLTAKASLAIQNITIVPVFVGDAIPKMFDMLRKGATMLVPQHV